MSKTIKAFIVTLLLACMLCLPAGNAWADMGGFAGGSDYTSSGDSGGYSYSGGSSSYDNDDDDDTYYPATNWDDFDTDDVPENVKQIIGAIFLLFILYFFFGRRIIEKFTDGKKQNYSAAPRPVVIKDEFDTSKLRSIGLFNKVDPYFNQETFKAKMGEWYVNMQHAWTAKDMEPVRSIFDDKLYSQFDNQLDSMRRRGQTNYVDDIVVRGVKYEGWYKEGDKHYLSLRILTTIVDYTKDDTTGRLISGSETDKKLMTYRWVLSRSADAVSESENHMSTVNCPNCGAELQMNQTSQCPYCGSTVSLEKHDWVITKIQGLEQLTKK